MGARRSSPDANDPPAPPPSRGARRTRQPSAAKVVDAALRTSLPALRARGLTPGTLVLVGLSGGQDSLTLAHALLRLQPHHGWRLHASYVDHCLRPASAAEAAQLAQTCTGWRLPFTALRVDVPAYRQQTRLNLQAAARNARYQALASLAATLDAAAVCVAHTADDVAETLLLHLLRGAGLDGLSAMPLFQRLPLAAFDPPLPTPPPSNTQLALEQPPPFPRREGGQGGLGLPLARPLLAVARATTAAYCAEHGLAPFREPPATYRRNRVRDELLPHLARYNPAIGATLARTSAALAEERAVVDDIVAAVYRDLATREGEGLAFPLDRWQSLRPAVQRRLLRRAVAELAGRDTDLSTRSLDAALSLADAAPGRTIDLPHGLRLSRQAAHLLLLPVAQPTARPAGASIPLHAVWQLPVPGSVDLPELGRLHAAVEAPGAAPWRGAPASECWLDAAALALPLRVRFRRAGDRFQPLGMDQTKRLQDFFVDARVPKQLRDAVPLIIAGDAIVWVAGWRIAHPARLRPESRTAIHLRWEAWTAENRTAARALPEEPA